MLRLDPPQVDTLWDSLLPEGVGDLPADLRGIDEALTDRALLEPFRTHWDLAALGRGRPTIPMATFVRLMVLKHRYRWGYETLLKEVSDSLHLRRFCLIALHTAVPDESTVRKLVRRLGAPVVDECIRALIAAAVRERRFRPRAMRCDSTVVAADIQHPTDAGLALQGVRLLHREARAVVKLAGKAVGRVRDRSRAVGIRMREVSRSLRRRTGGAKEEVFRLIGEAGRVLRRSLGEAKRMAAEARRRARGRGAQAKLRAVRRLEDAIEVSERVVSQSEARSRQERIPDRVVSLADPDARAIRKGKLARPTEFGYVAQLAELTPHTRRGARGLILPPKVRPGAVNDNLLLPETVAELARLDLRPKEAVFDGAFGSRRTAETLTGIGCDIFITGRATGARSPRTTRRLRRYRTGVEGRISHLKRGYGAGRTRLRRTEGAQTWESWAVLSYDLDTISRIARVEED